jgi:hypothetical protein
MERQQWICPQCSKAISPDDTFILDSSRLSHLDCKRPRVLSPEERVALFRFCWEHTVAECEQCAKGYRVTELASDLFSGREHLCPQCRADLLGSVRAHLYSCAILSATVLQRLREARVVAQRLVKRGREPSDVADVLMRELEVALHALREAAVEKPPQSGAVGNGSL